MNLPLVSYIIITMNRQDELKICLSSLREQDYPHKQIIVVDNGSTDDTINMVRTHFPEITLLALETNQGVAGGRNRGGELAQGEICIFIDDDAQFIDSQATRRTMTYCQTDSQLAGVAFFIREAFTGREEKDSIPRADKRLIGKDSPCSYFSGCGFALKRQIFVDLGMFWEKLQPYGGEELDFSYRLLDSGYRLIWASSIEVMHRKVPQARPTGQFVYSYSRNRPWVAVRNLPWIYALSTSLLWWSRTFLIGLKQGHLHFFIRGLWDSINGLPTVLRERRPISKVTVRELKELSGRLWY